MARRASDRPTEAELEILQVLWNQGPASVRAVNEALNLQRPTGYTTTLKLMQIMAEKGILSRDESVRPQIYRPARSQRQTQKQLVSDVLDRVFGGSPGKLVMQALAAKRSTPGELQEIRDLLDRLEEDDQ